MKSRTRLTDRLRKLGKLLSFNLIEKTCTTRQQRIQMHLFFTIVCTELYNQLRNVFHLPIENYFLLSLKNEFLAVTFISKTRQRISWKKNDNYYVTTVLEMVSTECYQPCFGGKIIIACIIDNVIFAFDNVHETDKV